MTLRDRLRPSGCRKQTAEREEMRLERAEAALVPGFDDRAHERTGGPHREELACEPGVARKTLHRDPHAASARIPGERRQAGGPPKPDPNRMLHPEVAEPAEPREQRRRFEAELGDDMDRQADGFRG